VETKSIELKTNIELFEANASVSLNPLYQWAKIVVCDSDPNANKQQVPESEFDNIIKTGINAPIKMARNQISKGHKEALGNPIGVISNLSKEGNKVIALAALWSKERPDDIALLKKMYDEGNPPNVSFELAYASSDMVNDVEVLKDCVLNGLAVVGMPAYSGRTPFIAFSSVEIEEVTAELSEAAVWTRAFIDDLPDSAFLYVESGGKKDGEGKTVPRSLRHFPYKDSSGKTDLPHLRNAIARIPQSNISDSLKSSLQSKAQKLLSSAEASTEDNKMEEKELEQAKLDLQKKEELLKTKEAEFTDLKTKFDAMEPEFTTLKQFKVEADTQKANAEKLTAIKGKFSTAGIQKDEKYFEEKKAELLSMADSQLDFVIQELVSFAKASANVATASVKVPVITVDNVAMGNKEIIKALLESKTAKEN
jgi:hypothetical protein